jgi:hypothetical protein
MNNIRQRMHQKNSKTKIKLMLLSKFDEMKPYLLMKNIHLMVSFTSRKQDYFQFALNETLTRITKIFPSQVRWNEFNLSTFVLTRILYLIKRIVHNIRR